MASVPAKSRHHNSAALAAIGQRIDWPTTAIGSCRMIAIPFLKVLFATRPLCVEVSVEQSVRQLCDGGAVEEQSVGTASYILLHATTERHELERIQTEIEEANIRIG